MTKKRTGVEFRDITLLDLQDRGPGKGVVSAARNASEGCRRELTQGSLGGRCLLYSLDRIQETGNILEAVKGDNVLNTLAKYLELAMDEAWIRYVEGYFVTGKAPRIVEVLKAIFQRITSSIVRTLLTVKTDSPEEIGRRCVDWTPARA